MFSIPLAAATARPARGSPAAVAAPVVPVPPAGIGLSVAVASVPDAFVSAPPSTFWITSWMVERNGTPSAAQKSRVSFRLSITPTNLKLPQRNSTFAGAGGVAGAAIAMSFSSLVLIRTSDPVSVVS